MIEVHAEFPQREVIQANAVVDNEEKTISEVIISAKPEITGVTASVDNNVGVSYVDVTPTGTGTDYSFDLAFHNLKGDKGDTGSQGPQGIQGEQGPQGIQGPKGETGATGNGIASITKTASIGLEDDYTINFTNGTQTVYTVTNGADGQDGTNGTDGQDGYSPIATVTQTLTGATISITDKNGTTTADVANGTNGTNGTNGVDGFSPIATVTKSGSVTTFTVTDKNGTTTEQILDGTGTVNSVNNIAPDSNGNVTLTIPAAQVNSDWNANSGVAEILNKPSLATVATSGSYTDLSNQPTIPTVPTNVSAFTNDAGYTTNTGTVTSVNGVLPDESGNVTIQGGGGGVTVDNSLSLTSENPVQNKVITQTLADFSSSIYIDSYLDSIISGNYSELPIVVQSSYNNDLDSIIGGTYVNV